LRTYILLGGAGVFAVHTAQYLLTLRETGKVISVGRNIERGVHYTLGVGKGDPRYRYEQIHIVFEQDRIFELFDRERPDVVVNFAALAYATSWEKSYRYYETNLVALAKICEGLMARDYLKKFLQIGTSELYGSVDHPVDEDAPVKPTSPYAVSKLAADMHLETLWAVKKFPMNIIRPSNAYGPGQQVWRVLPRAVLCGLTGEKLPLQGGGIVRKSYLHTQDLARAIQMIADNAPPGRTYNAGPDEPVSIRKLVEIVAEEMEIPFDQLCEMVPGRVGEDQQYWLDSARIRDQLGWKPEIDLRTGVRDMIAWGRKYRDAIRQEETEFVLRA
jgi:dTDP-glucose 4,6-dehydratase